MPLMYDWQLGHAVYLPDDAVTDAVGSGRYTFRRGVRIPVIGPDGQPTEIAAEDAQAAFTPDYGYRWRGTQETEALRDAEIARIRQEEFGGAANALAAGTLGAARGLSFGMSDAAIRAVYGERGAEATRMLRDEQGAASLVGEVGGILAGTLATGGLAGAAGTGVQGAARAGAAVERGVAGLLAPTSRLGQVMAKAAASGAGSATEGLFYGAGQLVSEAALGDPALNTQHAITTIGLSGLMSGALGGLTKGGIEAYKAGRGALRELADRVAAKENAIAGIADKTSQAATEAVQGAFEGYAKVLRTVRGLDDEAAQTISTVFDRTNTQGRDRIMKALENPRYVAEEGTTALRKIIEEAQDRADDVMSNRNAVQAGLMNVKIDGTETKAVQGVLGQIDDVLADMNRHPARYQGGEKLLQDLRDDLFGRLWNTNGSLKKGVTKGDVHLAMHDMRKLIDDVARPFEVQNVKTTTRAFENVRKIIRGHLRDTTLYGDDIARWAKADDLYTEIKDAAKDLTRQFGRETFRTDDEALALLKIGKQRAQRTLDEEKVRRWLLNPESMKSMQTTQKLARFQQATKELQDEAIAIAQATGNTMPQIRNLDEIAGAIGALQEARASITMLNALESQTGKSLHGLLLGGMAGTTFLGDEVPGAGLIGAGVGAAFANPRAALRYLAAFERRRAEGQNLIRAAVGSFLHRGVSTAKSVSKAMGTPIKWDARVERALGAPVGKWSLAKFASTLSGEPEVADDKRPVRRLREVLEEYKNPERIDQRLQTENPYADESVPENYAQANGVVARAVQFLDGKVPAQSSSGALLPGDLRLSNSQRQKLERYVTAISEPRVLLQQLAAGRVDRDTVEAIRAVYPEMYAELQEQILTFATQNPDAIDYRQALQLGILFGVPSIPALADLASNQASMAELSLENAQREQQQKRALADTAANQAETSITRALNR